MKPNPEKITPDNPEATEVWFAKARPASLILPEIFGEAAPAEMLKPKRGRPALAQTKPPVNIRLDPDIVTAFRKSGAGWQTKINDALKEWLKTQD